MSNPQMPQVIAVAKSQVGVREDYTEGNWTNVTRYADEVPGLSWAQGESWCMIFTSWVAMRAGVASLFPRTASCGIGVEWFTTRSRWNWYPAVGAHAFYGQHGSEHAGIVIAYDATHIWAVEANTNDNGSSNGDGVYIRKRRRTDPFVYGYGYPNYSEGIITADPSKKGVAGYTHALEHRGPGPTEKVAGGTAVENFVAETATVNGPIHSGRVFIQQNDRETVAFEVVGFSSTGKPIIIVKDPNGNTCFEVTAPGAIIQRGNSSFTQNVQVGAETPDVGGGSGVIGIKDASTVPASNPTNGGVLFVEGGALKWRGSSGTVTTIAPA